MELERLRAEKEKQEDDEKERSAQGDVEPLDSPATSSRSGPTREADQMDGKVEGYKPDGYGRDDPYRRPEDTQGERPGAGWIKGSVPPPKSRPPPKILLSRGQEEAVEAGTGARVIQKRQNPPAAILRVSPQQRTQHVRPFQPPPAEQQDAHMVHAAETAADALGEPSQLLRADRHGRGEPASTVVEAESVREAPGEKGRAESSLSLQWLTPRRDDAHSEGRVKNVSHGARPTQPKGPPSAWVHPVTSLTASHPDRERGDNHAAGGAGAANLPPRSPHVPPMEGGHENQRHAGQAARRAGHGEGKHWPAPGESPGPGQSKTGRSGSFGKSSQPMPPPPPSPFGKEGHHGGPSTFFGGSGQSDREGSQERQNNQWPQAGRGPPPPPPPPREHKRIFDHKTGKLRHVEVRRNMFQSVPVRSSRLASPLSVVLAHRVSAEKIYK